MRLINLAVFSSVAVLLSGLGCYSNDEPVKQPGISFSVPYRCNHLKTIHRKTVSDRICLSDSFEPELNVVLVNKEGNCSTKTVDTFTDEHAGFEFKATRLKGIEGCLTESHKKGFRIAVVGMDPSAVRVVEPKTDESPLSKEIQSGARKVASLAYQEMRGTTEVRDVADSPPEVFSVGRTAFLLFKCTDEFLNQDGLPVLILNNNAFVLEGSCAFRSPFFFSVNGKLHVAYWATVACCGCGDSQFFVYDLSGESPKLVYRNSNFSD
jgi:hypothetical protein